MASAARRMRGEGGPTACAVWAGDSPSAGTVADDDEFRRHRIDRGTGERPPSAGSPVSYAVPPHCCERSKFGLDLGVTVEF